MNINRETIEHIKAFEGKRLKAYRDPVGIWTIGYGHTTAAGPPTVVSGLTITDAEADEILWRDVEKFATGVRSKITVDLTDNQFGALVSFAYNVGLGNFSKSTLLKKVNGGDFKAAADQFMRWTRAKGKVLPGLIRRREAERSLFLKRA